jgi:hypothetical protein
MTVGIGSKLAKFGKVANLLRRFGRTERLHDKILHEVSDIITDPSVRWEANRTVRGIDRFKARGIRDDVEIEVIVEPKGEGIISAWPVSGHGVSVNPL